MGIIGRNGAGKSTLLKILSRITEPTKGRFEIFGRVSSLLEVGTGFHPELTGRENVYLNGTILGMKRREVKAKFDEIVAFSGVEKFIDTPVKHYSSGMQVRLAFAVAAHLEPEILIIDEVLTVGDAEFQKKCLGKMEDVTGEGRTVLFVSHNMGAITKLCDSGILLEQGKITASSNIHNVLEAYDPKNYFVDSYIGEGVVKKVELLDSELKQKSEFNLLDEVNVAVDVFLSEYILNPVVGIVIKDKLGSPLSAFNNLHYSNMRFGEKIDKGRFIVNIPKIPYTEGIYGIDIYISESAETIDKIVDCMFFKVNDTRNNGLKLNPTINKVFIENVKWRIAT